MTDDADSRALADATASFLADHDDGERALEAVLEVDSAAETWTFDDLAVDSGTFGELVSRGIVEKTGGAYRVDDTEIVEAVLAGEDVPAESSDGEPSWRSALDLDFGHWGDRRAMGGLFGALLLVLTMRLTQYGAVFRGEHVVSPGNDPYFYRYWMEELLAESSSPTDIEVITSMPDGALSRPLTHAVNWWLATLLGGDQWAADMVAAWLPVVSTLVLGVIIYAIAMLLTRDARVGIASVVLFGLTPVHAVYTGLGFLEHRLHQYLWLGMTLLTLAWLAVDLQRRIAEEGTAGARERLQVPTTWLVAGLLGISIAFSTHIWAGSPLVLLPLGIYLGLRAVVDVRRDVSPVFATLPIIVALGIGSAIAAGLHLRWGWHEAFLAFTPLLVFLGAIGVAGLGEVWRRYQLPSTGLVGLQGVGLVIGTFIFRWMQPEYFARIQSRAAELLLREGFTESVSLFALEHAVIGGPLIQLGVGFYLGLAVLGWTILVAYRRYEPKWLLLAVYVSYFIVLAGIQVRFAAQLAIPLSVLGGIGFVYVLSSVDLARRPFIWLEESRDDRALVTDGGRRSIDLPKGRRLAYVFGIGLLVCGFGLIYVPSLSGQVSYEESQAQAAMIIDEHAEDHDREWRDNAAFSHMGDNRMYNYFVSGESRSYLYVDSWYGDFVTEDDPDAWVDRLDGRFGYVVAHEDNGLSPEQLGADGNRSLDHYALLYVSDDRETAVAAIVDGAMITGTAEPETTVTVGTTVEVRGESFTYERQIEVGESGQFEVTVPYAGEYLVGNDSIEVTEDQVLKGTELKVNSNDTSSSN